MSFVEFKVTSSASREPLGEKREACLGLESKKNQRLRGGESQDCAEPPQLCHFQIPEKYEMELPSDPG